MVQTLFTIMKRRGAFYTVMDSAGHWGTYCKVCEKVDFSDSGKGKYGVCPKHFSLAGKETFEDKFVNLLTDLNLKVNYVFTTSNCTICWDSKTVKDMDLEEISSIFDEPKKNFSHIKNPTERVKAWLRSN